MHQQEAFLQRTADMVGKLQRRRAGATLGTIDHNKIRGDARHLHGFDDSKPFPRVADAEFEAGRFAA